MFRSYFVIFVLILGLVFQSCATLEYLDGSSKEEIRRYKMTKGEVLNEVDQLKIENTNFQRQNNILNILTKEYQKINDENKKKIAMMRYQNELLNEQIAGLKQESERSNNESQVLRIKLATFQRNHEKKKLMIKVLSGDGDLNYAKEVAKKLQEMGYTIKSVDYAPQSKFSRNTIYFAPKFKSEANRLILSLGDSTISKPLCWYSVFDLIVVSSKKSSSIVTAKK